MVRHPGARTSVSSPDFPSAHPCSGTAGLHPVDNLDNRELLERIRSSIKEGPLLPLPQLRAPNLYEGSSTRVRKRERNKRALFGMATKMALSLGWLHCGRSSFSHTSGGPLALSEMSPSHRNAWSRLLTEAKQLRSVRREVPFQTSLTGAQAMETLLKRPILEYATARNTYVPIDAKLIAEPSQPHSLPILEMLPPALAEFYSSEESVLQGGQTDAKQLTILRRLGSKIGGSRDQYIQYLNRTDVIQADLWSFLSHDKVKGMAAFKAVWEEQW